jgi:molybdopterin converting factor small subunit
LPILLSNRYNSCILSIVRILVRLFGGLRGYSSSKTLEINAIDGATIADVVDSLGLRPGEVWLATVDGQLADMDHQLQPDDELALVPPVGGGR